MAPMAPGFRQTVLQIKATYVRNRWVGIPSAVFNYRSYIYLSNNRYPFSISMRHSSFYANPNQGTVVNSSLNFFLYAMNSTFSSYVPTKNINLLTRRRLFRFLDYLSFCLFNLHWRVLYQLCGHQNIFVKEDMIKVVV